MIDYTLVLGLDHKHLDQFKMVRPTWMKHKPSLWDVPWIVFYDRKQITREDVRLAVDHPRLITIGWPVRNLVYGGSNKDKWYRPQRYKMLAGFVHVPAAVVKTKYWLKVDVDTVASGNDDWIDPEWFKDDPAVVSHPWNYTKPPHQMMELDRWVEENKERMMELASKPPLNLRPNPGSDLVRHKRIISWCSFWRTDFVQKCSYMASVTCGSGMLPLPTQDGYLWYCAKRMDMGIIRPNMKSLGWEHRSSMQGIQGAVREAMKGDCDGEI